MLGYVSPVGKLAEFFRSSRDRWKARSIKLQQKIKALDGKVRDLTVSRDAWKAKATDLRRELEDSRKADKRRPADNAATQQASKNTTAQSAVTKASTNTTQAKTLPGLLARRVVTGELLHADNTDADNTDADNTVRQNASLKVVSSPPFCLHPRVVVSLPT